MTIEALLPPNPKEFERTVVDIRGLQRRHQGIQSELRVRNITAHVGRDQLFRDGQRRHNGLYGPCGTEGVPDGPFYG